MTTTVLRSTLYPVQPPATTANDTLQVRPGLGQIQAAGALYHLPVHLLKGHTSSCDMQACRLVFWQKEFGPSHGGEPE